jgi:predicted ATP-binding protein involved in virulence
MKLIEFKANSVYDFLDFDIKFNNDLSFLVGGNGSGKSTILKLINAILTPNLKDIFLIPFSSLALTIEIEKKLHTINITQDKQFINFSLNSDNKNILKLEKIQDEDELGYILSRHEEPRNYYNDIFLDNKHHPVFNFIHEIDVPIFLGLNRRDNMDKDINSYMNDRERIRMYRKRIGRNRYINGTLGQSLLETEEIIRDAYEKIRKFENKQRMNLRDNIIISAFNMTDLNDVIGDDKIIPMNRKEQKEILERKEEIELTLEKMGIRNAKLSGAMNTFFTQIENLISNSQSEGINLAWLINKSQIDMISSLVKLIDENNEKVEKRFKNINKFRDILNHFFSDSNKKIIIDNIGNIKIQKPNKKVTSIDALSSGERQLLVIFSHLIFKNESNPSGIFVIDEPELSLHLKWQTEFIQFALECSPNTQLIFATHSPEIIVENENKTILVRSKK